LALANHFVIIKQRSQAIRYGRQDLSETKVILALAQDSQTRRKAMILRSGLIENRKDVDEAGFARHWRDVHGPLAARLPGLIGYVQNHIVARAPTRHNGVVHRIDGVSQLWFADIESMQTGMASPEQDACVRDISGFLQRVTLAIQIPGVWETLASVGAGAARKALAIYVGRDGVSELRRALVAALKRGDFAPTRFRINRIVEGEFVVDPSVAHDHAALSAILEAEFADDAARERAFASGALDVTDNPAAAAILAVEPILFVAPPA
jgi:uncharacterized protein (TIGR02118 family)